MFILDIFKTVAFMEKDSTNGKMEVLMKDNSLRVKGKEKELGKEQMVTFLKDSITMTWKMDGENLNGSMDRSTKDNSKMTFDMEKEPIVTQVVN